MAPAMVVRAVARWLSNDANNSSIDAVYFCVFEDADEKLYRNILPAYGWIPVSGTGGNYPPEAQVQLSPQQPAAPPRAAPTLRPAEALALLIRSVQNPMPADQRSAVKELEHRVRLYARAFNLRASSADEYAVALGQYYDWLRDHPSPAVAIDDRAPVAEV